MVPGGVQQLEAWLECPWRAIAIDEVQVNTNKDESVLC
ncbi:hypothetical protein PENVUL_c018G05227 [Penicillium vulpinum]|uniref:Uncharacterized protein n=1 Tax=Penicillium vulpinum TaxID=29845 RepID=A0A1V6RY47_9EURO|nr:hypothetical protein PENVUL_c018G05227 [Penicillium vulpinum]